jgi:hypothetical protein
VVKTPGAASAVCGAYLLPRTLISVVDPTVQPPPLLLVPALAFDVTVWLRASDVVLLTNAWPRPGRAWRKREARPRRIGPWRATAAGAVFGAVLSTIEPPFAILLGGDPLAWSGAELWLAACLCVVACGGIGLSARGTES